MILIAICVLEIIKASSDENDESAASCAVSLDGGDDSDSSPEALPQNSPKTKFDNPPVPVTKVLATPYTDPDRGAPSAEHKRDAKFTLKKSPQCASPDTDMSKELTPSSFIQKRSSLEHGREAEELEAIINARMMQRPEDSDSAESVSHSDEPVSNSNEPVSNSDETFHPHEIARMHTERKALQAQDDFIGERVIIRTEDHEAAALPIAVMMVSAILIGAVIFAMTHARNVYLADNTFLLVENSLAVFIAVLWFQAIHEVFELSQTQFGKVFASAGHAAIWLILIVSLAWFVRENPPAFATVASVGAYIAGFAAAHAAYTSQKHYFSQHWLQCIIGIIVLIVMILLLTIVVHYLKKSLFHEIASKDNNIGHLTEVAEGIENFFWAMALSVALTEFFRFTIVGKFPELVDRALYPRHSLRQRAWLLVWAIVLLAIGLLTVPRLRRLQKTTILPYIPRRAIGIYCSLVPICVAWAFLDWGQWHLYEEFDFVPILARVAFADVCTMFGLFGVFLLAVPLLAGSYSTDLCIQALSLMLAWSWEQVFDETFQGCSYVMSLKLLMTVVIGAVLIPIMVVYLKPITLSIMEQQRL